MIISILIAKLLTIPQRVNNSYNGDYDHATPRGGGDHEDHGAVVWVLQADDVSESPVDEGGPGGDDHQTGDPNVDPPTQRISLRMQTRTTS